MNNIDIDIIGSRHKKITSLTTDNIIESKKNALNINLGDVKFSTDHIKLPYDDGNIKTFTRWNFQTRTSGLVNIYATSEIANVSNHLPDIIISATPSGDSAFLDIDDDTPHENYDYDRRLPNKEYVNYLEYILDDIRNKGLLSIVADDLKDKLKKDEVDKLIKKTTPISIFNDLTPSSVIRNISVKDEVNIKFDTTDDSRVMDPLKDFNFNLVQSELVFKPLIKNGKPQIFLIRSDYKNDLEISYLLDNLADYTNITGSETLDSGRTSYIIEGNTPKYISVRLSYNDKSTSYIKLKLGSLIIYDNCEIIYEKRGDNTMVEVRTIDPARTIYTLKEVKYL